MSHDFPGAAEANNLPSRRRSHPTNGGCYAAFFLRNTPTRRGRDGWLGAADFRPIGSMGTAVIAAERLSELIGRIYDCVVEPDRWSDTMREICAELACLFSAIILFDLKGSQHKFFKDWNNDPAWRARYPQFYQEMTTLFHAAPGVLTRAIDEPLVLSRDLPPEAWVQSRIYREWAKPRGVCDSLLTVVLREPGRLGVFAANRHESKDVATDAEISLLRLLAPHIRRAVTISDLLDLKSLERQALAATLDHLSAGVFIVAEEQRILHANEAGGRMLKAGEAVRSSNGRLSAHDRDANSQLANAIHLAQRNEAEIGATGIGVALREASGEPAVAHVLPLARGDLRTRLVPQATAAVFVTQAINSPAIDLVALAASLGLTDAEMRLLKELIAGVPLGQAASALGIAETTAKTHLGHIFSKTGVSRQADLIALIHRLAPPLRADRR